MNGQITWTNDSLTGGGTERIFNISGTISSAIDYLFLENYTLTYNDQNSSVIGNPIYSFPGDSVPVWAIQGRTFRSPYLLQKVKTSGVVTAVFPEIEGFWLQGEEDQDPLTSHGIFIYSQIVDPNIKAR